MKKSSILKLETEEGVIEGHDSCAKYLEDIVGDLLLEPAKLDKNAQVGQKGLLVPQKTEN